MPCYNLGKYIDEALRSLSAQTFTDYTLVISDDCSTDKHTVDKLQAIQAQNEPHIQVHFEHKNIGMNQICSKYIPRFATEYVLMLSADDTLEPTFLEETVQFLDTHPSYAAVTTFLNCFGESNAPSDATTEWLLRVFINTSYSPRHPALLLRPLRTCSTRRL